MDAVYDNLISGNAYYLIIKSIIVTLVIAVIAWILSFVLGIFISYFMCYEKRIISGLAKGVCFVLRSAPALIIMLLFYYVLFKKMHISPILTASIALSLYGAGHFAEIMAHTVLLAQRKQDNAVTLRLQHMFYSIAAPQAVEESWFLIKRLTVQILQWTAVAGYITVNDLTEVLVRIGQRTMYPFFSLFCCLVFYLVLVIIVEWVFKVLSKKFVPYELEDGYKEDEADEDMH